MNTRVTWKIASVKCIPEIDGKKNVVQEIEWLATAENDGFEGSVNGRQAIVYDPQNFVVFEDLTESQMVQWVKAVMTDERIVEIESKAIELTNPVQTQSTEQEPVAVKLPWVK
jgi:hypothetical protein